MPPRNVILGLNAYHGDSSACLVVDGQLLAAVEEERFRRVKHWAGLPVEAVRYCLESAGLGLEDVDHIAINRDPSAHVWRKRWYALTRLPSPRWIADRLANRGRVREVDEQLALELGVRPTDVRARVHNVEHHRAHLASAFFVSPFERAAVVSVDGFGDFGSAAHAVGEGGRLDVRDRVFFPHSLGHFYLALTQYLGFPKYGDEYKVMGLAPYGEPLRLREMRRIVRLLPRGRFELELGMFTHHRGRVATTWRGGSPEIERAYSENLVRLLGPARRPDEPVEKEHFDLAASCQAMYEEALMHLLRHVQQSSGERRLCLAGGCAMNSVANGKIRTFTDFEDVFIQPAAGDAGGALGAAFSVWNEVLGRPRSFTMTHAYHGPGSTNEQILDALRGARTELEPRCEVRRFDSSADLCRAAATSIGQGDVIGWYQGRAEWGARALGNRSILADPRRRDMRDIINRKIKFREAFRPFAPSVLREEASEWFDTSFDVPFMQRVVSVREDRRDRIPAVTHVDGTGRVQTVTQEANARYHELIRTFHELTGVPVLLNTSFNENEPIVNTPEEAIACFLRTDMDRLFLGDFCVSKVPAEPVLEAAHASTGPRSEAPE